MALLGCGSDGDSVATFTHDLAGGRPLYSYPAEPAADTRGGERLANNLYGIATRSPKTPYICVWRDPDPTRFRAKADAGPPLKVLLGCHFGTDAWSPPTNLLEHATQAARREHATVTIGWTRSGDDYVMDRLEVEIPDAKTGRSFRSVWFGEEVAALPFDRKTFGFPTSPVEPLAFDIAAAVPRRYNKGEPTSAPTAIVAMKGTAQPIPDWVLY